MKHIAQALARQGRGPDTELLHVSKNELKALHGLAALHGGKLTTNPKTGLTEAGFFDKWAPIRDKIEGAAVLAGNYYLPGSSILTSHLVSDGAQHDLNHTKLGALLQLGTGIGGSAANGYSNYTKLAGMGGAPETVALTGPGSEAAAWEAAGANGGYGSEQAMWNAEANGGAGVSAGVPGAAPAAAANGGAGVSAGVPGAAPAAAGGPGLGSMASSAGSWIAEHPYLSAAGAGIAYDAMHKPEPAKPHEVYMAGPSTSGRTATGAPVSPYDNYYGPGADTSERNYFANNRLDNYTSAPGTTVMRYAQGGILNLRPQRKSLDPMFTQGAGDGMSDSIPAYIDGAGKRPHEPIKVADGEYIVPADAVSHLGNGSSNAGAKKLDGMIAKVRKARTGKTKQPGAVNTARFMPA